MEKVFLIRDRDRGVCINYAADSSMTASELVARLKAYHGLIAERDQARAERNEFRAERNELREFVKRWSGIIQGKDKLSTLEGWARDFVTQAAALVPKKSKPKAIAYECEICSGVHRWEWSGDCREDAERFPGVEELATHLGVSEYEIELRSMADRVGADEGGAS